MPKTKPISRREFIGLTGLTVTVGGLSCLGGLLGYLALRPPSSSKSASAPHPATTPIDATPRPAYIKQIDRPPITTRAEWGARAVDHEAVNESGFYSMENVEGWREYEGDLRDMYKTVVVHHSVLYRTDDITTMQAIQNQHMDLRGWADIAYHFGVGKSGQVFEGRDLKARGTHTYYFNTGSVGVVFFGNFNQETPTYEQLDAGRWLIDWLALRLELTHIAGHRDFNDDTDCPGRNLYYYLEAFGGSAGLIVGTSGYEPPPEQLTPTAPSET